MAKRKTAKPTKKSDKEQLAPPPPPKPPTIELVKHMLPRTVWHYDGGVFADPESVGAKLRDSMHIVIDHIKSVTQTLLKGLNVGAVAEIQSLLSLLHLAETISQRCPVALAPSDYLAMRDTHTTLGQALMVVDAKLSEQAKSATATPGLAAILGTFGWGAWAAANRSGMKLPEFPQRCDLYVDWEQFQYVPPTEELPSS